MIINKITTGFVIQTFDSATGKFLTQEFIAGDQVDYENLFGEAVDAREGDNYLPFDMYQPNESRS